MKRAPLGSRELSPAGEGMRQALHALTLRAGPVPYGFEPPPSTFPLTPAAREALRMDRAAKKAAKR